MAGDIKDQIGEIKSNIENAMSEALKEGSLKAHRYYNKLLKMTDDYLKAQEDIAKAQEEINKINEEGAEITEEQAKQLRKYNNVIAKASKTTEDYEETLVKVNQAQEVTIAQYAEMWKKSTLAGKAVGSLTGAFGKLAGGITAASLAYKALDRWQEAAEIRQEILIQNFRGFAETSGAASEGIMGMGKSVLNSAESLFEMNKALQTARIAAYKMGVPVEQVNQAMIDMSRIAGTSNPEALGKLTSAIVTTSRTLGITMPEAVEYVQLRMDKFGGSAASAVISMNNIRESTEDMNGIFGRTVVRGDDVVRMLMNISKSSSVYAIDQRMVSGMLRENIARLQATGDGYDQAKRKAEAYLEAITGSQEMPQYARILVGRELVNKMTAAAGEQGGAASEAWLREYHDMLEAAGPGLSEKIRNIIADPTLGSFSKTQLVQELMSGTELGIRYMNKMIIKMGKGREGLQILIRDYGAKTEEGARAMLAQAEASEARAQEIDKLVEEKDTKKIAEKLGIHEDIVKSTFKENKSLHDQRNAFQTILSIEESIEAAEQEKLRTIERQNRAKERGVEIDKQRDVIKAKIQEIMVGVEDKKAQEQYKSLTSIIEKQTNQLAEMGEDDEGRKELEKSLAGNKEALDKLKEGALKGSKGQLTKYEAMLRNLDESKAQLTKKHEDDKESVATMEDMTKEHLDLFKEYSATSGGDLHAMKESLSSIQGLLAGAIALWGGGQLLKLLGRKSMGGGGKLFGQGKPKVTKGGLGKIGGREVHGPRMTRSMATKKLPGKAGKLTKKLINSLKSFKGSLKGMTKSGGGKGVWSSMGDAAKRFGGSLKNSAGIVGKNFKSLLKILKGPSGLIKTFARGSVVFAGVLTIWGTLKGLWQNFGNALEKVKGMFTELSNMGSALGNIFGQWKDGAVESASEFWDYLKDGFKGMWDSSVEWILETLKSILPKEKFKFLMDSMDKAKKFGDAVGDSVEGVMNLPDTIADGVGTAIELGGSWLNDKVGGLATSLEKTAAEGAGPVSLKQAIAGDGTARTAYLTKAIKSLEKKDDPQSKKLLKKVSGFLEEARKSPSDGGTSISVKEFASIAAMMSKDGSQQRASLAKLSRASKEQTEKIVEALASGKALPSAKNITSAPGTKSALTATLAPEGAGGDAADLAAMGTEEPAVKSDDEPTPETDGEAQVEGGLDEDGSVLLRVYDFEKVVKAAHAKMYRQRRIKPSKSSR